MPAAIHTNGNEVHVPTNHNQTILCLLHQLSLATYPRCLLQKILLDIVGYIDPDWKGLRGRGSSTTDMYQYVMSAFTTLGLPTDKVMTKADKCVMYSVIGLYTWARDLSQGSLQKYLKV